MSWALQWWNWKETNSRKKINSHMFKYSMVPNHQTVALDDFTVLSSGYRNRKFKVKVSESLFIKQNRSMLNEHGTSVPLKLFNWYNYVVQRRIQNLVKCLRWSFLRKVSRFQPLAASPGSPSWTLHRFLNASPKLILMSLYY